MTLRGDGRLRARRTTARWPVSLILRSVRPRSAACSENGLVSNKAPCTDWAWGREWLPLLIAPTFALAALLPLLFDVMKDIPPSYDCGESAGADHDEKVASYQAGYEVLHGLALLLSLSAILALSVARKRREGAGGIGIPTICVVAGVGVATLLALLFEPARFTAVAVLLPAIALTLVAQPLGPQLTGLIAAALLAWAGVRATQAARTAGLLREQSALCWVLFVLTAGHALVVSQQGHGPYFC